MDNIENPPDTDVDDQIPDLFLNFVISFNLQFQEYNDNPVMIALSERNIAKFFTEKLLLLLNREGNLLLLNYSLYITFCFLFVEDPIRIFDHTPAPPHSLLKLFIDLFNSEETANLFYTNDIKVLIDIVVRNISDLSPEDLVSTRSPSNCCDEMSTK